MGDAAGDTVRDMERDAAGAYEGEQGPMVTPVRGARDGRTKKAGGKKKNQRGIENAPPTNVGDAFDAIVGADGGVHDAQQNEFGNDARGARRAQEMRDEQAVHMNEELDRVKWELKQSEERALELARANEEQKEKLRDLDARHATSQIFQEQIMTMVNYAVGPLQAELEAKKAETAKLYTTIGMQNARIAKMESDAKAAGEARATPTHPPTHPPLPGVSEQAPMQAPTRRTHLWHGRKRSDFKRPGASASIN